MAYAFISYNRVDRGYVERLAAHLRTHGIEVWYDYEIVVGDRFDSVIRARIDDCSAFISVMTPEAEASHWVGVEVQYALNTKKPVLPLLLRGKPFFALVNLEYEDVTGGRLPGQKFIARLAQIARTPQSGPSTQRAVEPAPGPPPARATAASTPAWTFGQPRTTERPPAGSPARSRIDATVSPPLPGYIEPAPRRSRVAVIAAVVVMLVIAGIWVALNRPGSAEKADDGAQSSTPVGGDALSDSLIRVGSALPLSGDNAATGRLHLVAGEVFLTRLKASGGLLGRDLAWVTFDDQSIPGDVEFWYEYLIDQRVDLLLGPPGEQSLLAAVEWAKPHGYVLPHSTRLTADLDYPCQFSGWPTGDVQSAVEGGDPDMWEEFHTRADARGFQYDAYENYQAEVIASWNAWEILVQGVTGANSLDQDAICTYLRENGADTTFSGHLTFR